MIFDDTIRIEASPQRVWDVLLDVNAVAGCMPGVEQVTQIDERTFDGVIVASVGPISGSFAFRASILDSTPPQSMNAMVEGQDSVTKSTIRAGTAFTLEPIEADSTDLSYHADVQIEGRLALLGDMLIRTTAVLILEEFVKRLRQRVADGNPMSSTRVDLGAGSNVGRGDAPPP